MSITKLTNSGLSGDKYPNLMADNTFMEPIATTLVGSGGSSNIVFSNIPQNYKHLQIRAIARNTVASTGYESVNCNFNNDSSASYAAHALLTLNVINSGNPYGSATTSTTTASTGVSTEGGELSNTFAAMILDILDYTNQNKYKTLRTLAGGNTNGGTDVMAIRSNLWMNTSAINKISLTCAAGNFAQNTRISLYGIRG